VGIFATLRFAKIPTTQTLCANEGSAASLSQERKMTVAKVTFQKLIQDSQDYGSDDEHMVSRAFFSVEVDGDVTDDVHVDIKQSIGSDFESTPLEVSKPIGYRGPFNYETFRQAVEAYYRSLVGGQGSGIHIEGGSNIRMRNNTFIQQEQVEFEVSKEGPAW